MKVLSIILVVLAVAYFLYGMAVAKSAPQEAVAAASGCFIAIMARIAQASGHHEDNMKKPMK